MAWDMCYTGRQIKKANDTDFVYCKNKQVKIKPTAENCDSCGSSRASFFSSKDKNVDAESFIIKKAKNLKQVMIRSKL